MTLIERPTYAKLYITDMKGEEWHAGYASIHEGSNTLLNTSLKVEWGFLRYFITEDERQELMPAAINLSLVSSWRLSYK